MSLRLNPSDLVPIITSTMLHHDPKTFVVSFAEPPRPDRVAAAAPTAGQPLGRVLAGLAAAGLATRLVEAVVGLRRS